MDQKFSVLSKRFKHIVFKWDQANWSRFKSQYIIHEIFKENGLIDSFLNRAEIKAWPPQSYELLARLGNDSWRYTYWEILETPWPDFFKARDILSIEEFLLYSPGVSEYLKTGSPNFFWWIDTSLFSL